MSLDESTDAPQPRAVGPTHLRFDPMRIAAYLNANTWLDQDYTPTADEALQALADLRTSYVNLASAYSATLSFALRAASDWRTMAEEIGPPSGDENTLLDSEDIEAGAVYDQLRQCATDLEVMLNLVESGTPQAQQFLEDEGRWPRLETLAWAAVQRSEIP